MTNKPFLTLDEQIAHLENNKNIVIEDKEKAKQALFNINYFNLIACSKIKFAQGLINNKYDYLVTIFEDWLDYYDDDCKASEYLTKNIIRIERKLNNRLALVISELLHLNKLTPNQKNEVEQLIKRTRKGVHYQGKRTWKFIARMTFGEMKKVLIWLQKNNWRLYLKVTKGYDWLHREDLKENEKFINELNHLRNNLVHFRPLNVYLTYGKEESKKFLYRDRKKLIRYVFAEKTNAEIHGLLKSFNEYSRNFLKLKSGKIKNSQTESD